MFRFTIRDVLWWIQRPMEAASATLIGASTFYWFAPDSTRRSPSVNKCARVHDWRCVIGALLLAFVSLGRHNGGIMPPVILAFIFLNVLHRCASAVCTFSSAFNEPLLNVAALLGAVPWASRRIHGINEVGAVVGVVCGLGLFCCDAWPPFACNLRRCCPVN
jgi:hypothetical protein